MAKSLRWRLRPRFSLKTFLLVCLVTGGLVGWLSHNYREYQTEQRLIQHLAKRTQPGTMMMVSVDGKTVSLVGGRMM